MTLNQPIDLERFRIVFVDWIKKSTEIETIWLDKEPTRPAYPFAGLAISRGPKPQSHSWYGKDTVDESRPVGQQIIVNKSVLCDMSVDCQIYSKSDDRDGSLAYSLAAIAELQSDDLKAAFETQNIAVTDVSDPQALTIGKKVQRIDRQIFTVDVTTAMNYTQYRGYIKYIELKSPQFGINDTIELE